MLDQSEAAHKLTKETLTAEITDKDVTIDDLVQQKIQLGRDFEKSLQVFICYPS